MRLTRLTAIMIVPAVILGLSKLHASVVAERPYDFTQSGRLAWALTLTVLILAGSYMAGLPSLVDGARAAALASLLAVGGGTLAISLAQLMLGDALLPRFVVFGSAAVLVPALTLLGTADVGTRHRLARRDRRLFVGGTAEGDQLARDLRFEPERPATLVAAVDVGDLIGTPMESGLLDRCRSEDTNVIVLDLSAQGDPAVVAQAAVAHEAGIRIRTLSLFYEEWLAKLPMSELERISLLFDVGELHRARYARLKRIVDIALGGVGLLALIVATPVVFLGNRAGNRGPLLFRQERVGKGGAVFTILKFRTMEPGSSDGTWTVADDPRVTSFGRVLRRWHVDELPQVVNIVRGDLSLVGPRPEQPRYVEELTAKLPFYRARHLVRPGLTGWAQVKYGYAGDERDALEKLQYEFYYLRRQGLLFDTRIIVRTFRHLTGRGGR